MRVPTKFDGKSFDQSVRDLIRRVPVAHNKIIKNEAMLLVEGLVKITAPKPGNEEKMKKRIWRALYQGYERGDPQGKPRRTFTVRGKKQTSTFRGIRGLMNKVYARRGFFAAGWIGKGNPLKARIPAQVRKQLDGAQGEVWVHGDIIGMDVKGINETAFVKHTPKWLAAAERILDAAMAYRSRAIQKKMDDYKRGARYRMRK